MTWAVDRLTKTYGRITALSEVTFSVRPGEVLGLIGPNGAGKTTLFECMSGVLPHDAGTVSAADVPLAPRARASQMFYLPDAIAPWPAQTVDWGLDFAIGFFGGRGSKRQVIERFGLEPLLRIPIGVLSKGQRKRALLAIGLLTPQPLLLADEPFEGLDLRQTRDVSAALREYAAGGRTLFLSIHQIADAARVCDRFVLLSGGRVCAEGTIADLSHRVNAPQTPDLEELFLALT